MYLPDKITRRKLDVKDSQVEHTYKYIYLLRVTPKEESQVYQSTVKDKVLLHL